MANLSKYRNSWLTPFGDFLEVDDFWNKSWMPRSFNSHPAVNIAEKENEFTVELAAPGYKKEDFKIDVDGNVLTISSEKEEEKKEEESNYTRREYNYSSFSRSFTLPEDVNKDAIDARYQEGVLNIALPRKEEAKRAFAAKQITVK